MPGRAEAYWRGAGSSAARLLGLWAFSKAVMVQILWGRAGLVPAAGHPFAQRCGHGAVR